MCRNTRPTNKSKAEEDIDFLINLDTDQNQAEKDIGYLIELDANNCVQVEGYPEDEQPFEIDESDKAFLEMITEEQKAKFVSSLLDTDY